MPSDDRIQFFGICGLSFINILMALNSWAFWGVWSGRFAVLVIPLDAFLVQYRIAWIIASVILVMLGVFVFLRQKRYIRYVSALVLAQFVIGWLAWLVPLAAIK